MITVGDLCDLFCGDQDVEVYDLAIDGDKCVGVIWRGDVCEIWNPANADVCEMTVESIDGVPFDGSGVLTVNVDSADY